MSLSEMQELELELKKLELIEKKRAFADREERELQAKLGRESGIEATRAQMKNQAAKEAGCAHLKENGRSHLAGQRDNNGVVHLICQGCQKHFIGNQVPTHLQPMHETVGGPH
jgi:hypothetical protein